jgi:hypothetical protein
MTDNEVVKYKKLIPKKYIRDVYYSDNTLMPLLRIMHCNYLTIYIYIYIYIYQQATLNVRTSEMPQVKLRTKDAYFYIDPASIWAFEILTGDC